MIIIVQLFILLPSEELTHSYEIIKTDTVPTAEVSAQFRETGSFSLSGLHSLALLLVSFKYVFLMQGPKLKHTLGSDNDPMLLLLKLRKQKSLDVVNVKYLKVFCNRNSSEGFDPLCSRSIIARQNSFL